MALAQPHTVIRHLHRLAGAGPAGGQTDAQLLQRYAASQDADAFAALVARHGPLVWSVCRRELGHDQDSEDAFKATFLVLARQAGAIRNTQTVAGWLYRVAYRTAVKARTDQVKRRAQERKAAVMPQAKPGEPSCVSSRVAWRELQQALDAELGRLPESLRAAFVLCCLEGKTKAEAAGQLGWKEGTVSGRVARARRLLQERLARRGITLSALLCATALSSAAGAAPPALVGSLVRAAVPGATADAVSSRARTLAEGVIRSMSHGKTKIVTLVAFLTGLLALGAGALLQHRAAAREAKPPSKPLPTEPRKQPGGPPQARGAAGKGKVAVRLHESGPTTVVRGKVLGPDAKAVAGARVAVIAIPWRWHRGRVGPMQQTVLGKAVSDQAGRFRLTVPALSADKYYEPIALATAKGHGLDWQWLDFRTPRKETTLRLGREQVIRGRLVNLLGQGAAGVKLHVTEAHFKTKTPASTSRVSVPGPVSWLSAWPALATTDAKGRFAVRGLGRDQIVWLVVLDDRFARQTLRIDTGAGGKPEAVRFSLTAARVLEGRVVAADSGKPMAKVFLQAPGEYRTGASDRRPYQAEGWTDKRGRFRFILPPGDTFDLRAYPANGEPYLCGGKAGDWPKGNVKQVVKVELPRGVVVSGKVTEAGSGKPVAGAVVEYYPDRLNIPKFGVFVLSWLGGTGTEYVQSGPRGKFRAVVYPGKGTLVVKAPGRGYVPVIFNGTDQGRVIFPEALRGLNFPKGTTRHRVAITLRRGVTLKGRLVGPDGKPVKRARLLCYFHHQGLLEIRDGTFALRGCDPQGTFPVFVLDHKNEFGAAVLLSGRQKGKPVTLRLERLGKAVVRVVPPKGKPPQRFILGLKIIFGKYDRAIPFPNLTGAAPDAKGRVTFPHLFPGLTYRYWWSENGKRFKEFKAEADKTVKLPDFKMIP
jgi:RNA polymerase sigma factor (sigma-70 family)